MKTNTIFRLFAAVAGFSALVWGGACTKDTLTAPVAKLEVNTESISVSKRGVDKNGNDAYIRVTSNVYWTATYAEDDREWLTLSTLAGDPGTTTIALRFETNEDATERHTTIHLETYDGTGKDITVIQRGTGEVIILMNDGFAGDYNEGTPISKYIPMSEGVDAETINFSGTEAYISKENSSYGYEGASGGNNVQLKGKDANLVVTGVNAMRDQAFDVNFGVFSSESFTTGDFALQISRDNEKWADVPYTISQPAQQSVTRADVAGWQMAIASFKIKEPVAEFYIRLMNVADRDFRVDDIAVEEGSDAAQEIEFPGDEPGPGPSGEVYLEENFDWITAEWGGSDYFDGNKSTTEVAITGKLAAQYQSIWDSHGFTSASGKAYCRIGCIKIGTTSVAGDIVTPRIAKLTTPTDLILTFKAVSYNSSEKDNTLKVNILGAGTADVTTLAITNYSYPNGVQTPEQNANWVEYTVNIAGADAGTQIQLQAGSAANCRFFFDDFKIEGSGEPEVPVEGLPVTWSFPATGVEDGLANPGEYYYLSDDRAARLEAVRGALPSKAGTYKAAELIPETGEYNNRLLMYGFAKDDSWQFSVPVKHLKAGKTIRLETELSASAAGAKFYILEYSVDKATWTAVNTKTGSFGTTDGTTVAAHDITYTVMLPYASSANERCEILEDFTVAEAIEDGTLYVRLRVCDALSNKLDKNILPANGGTNRVRRTMNADGTPLSAATSISLATGAPAPKPTVTIGGITGGKLTFDWDATAAKTFTVTSTVSDWTLTSEIDAWATVSPKSGKAGQTVTVSVTPKAANTGAVNTGALTFTAGTASQKVDVTQEAFVAQIDFDGVTGGSLPFDGASTAPKTFTVTSNVAWTAATTADWFDFAPKSGAAGAAVTVTVTPKSTYNGQGPRSADITFTAAGLSGEKVTVTQTPSGVTPAEGFPATWSFPATGEADGYVSKAEWWYLSDDKAARLDAVRATNPSTAANIPMSYTINASDKQDRILMYGMFLGDYWKFTVPVKHFKAGSTVNLSTTLSSSGTGAKYFVVEYSTDNTTWTASNTKDETITVGGVERTVTYTLALAAGAANQPCEVNENVTIPTAVEDGNIYLRLRVCDKLSQGGAADMKAAHNGTNRMFQVRTEVGGEVTGRRIGVTLVSDGPSASKRR